MGVQISHAGGGVDLRSRGGASSRRCDSPSAGGRSPLARRSRVAGPVAHAPPGSISARAEEPVAASCPGGSRRVDLRSRGGAGPVAVGSGVDGGRSPLARRSPHLAHPLLLGPGSISARAEEPVTAVGASGLGRVDLRSRGGAPGASSPAPLAAGRSPLARRSRGAAPRSPPASGSISARAEEPRASNIDGIFSRVDLRSRGGAPIGAAENPWAQGRSPLARRSLDDPGAPLLPRGSISARAEEPRPAPRSTRRRWVDLCSRGGASENPRLADYMMGRSPLARRSPGPKRRHRQPSGSISARAEEPSRR